MENSEFLSFNGISLLSHCRIYENDLNQKVHLIPVCHFGTVKYFYNLLLYIGDVPCIFENLNLNADDKSVYENIRDIDDYIEVYSIECEQIWQKYNKLLKNFYKKFLTKELKKLRKYIKKELKQSNEKIKKIYDLSEKTRFSFPNLIMIQLYWCELVNLVHQFIAIDYKNDIMHRPNWIHTDLNLGELKEQVDISEFLIELLTSPTPEQLAELQKEMHLVMLSILELLQIERIADVSQRRQELAVRLTNVMSQNYEKFESLNPEILLKTRNTLIEDSILNLIENNNELMVFYGATHMIGIEKFLFAEGFKYKADKTFEVFKIH
ncbi:MAG: hypothetical protein ACFFEY_18825 [Candidatus Thorarchaeota archaeon]